MNSDFTFWGQCFFVFFIIMGFGRPVESLPDADVLGLRPIAEVEPNGDLTRFVYGERSTVPDYMVPRAPSHPPKAEFTLKGSTRYRFVVDRLGSVRLVVNAATGYPKTII